MTETSFSVDQFNCPVCLDLLKDPVTTSCGHSYCMVCINGFWDKEHWKKVYSCPQCRERFTPRPVLRRNNMLAEVVEKLKKAELQAASPAHCYAGPGDVECDLCTGRKRNVVNSCVVCQASFCEDHLKPHHQSPAFKKHKLVEACAELQEKICSQHDKPSEDSEPNTQDSGIYLCKMDDDNNIDSTGLSLESLCASPGSDDPSSFTVDQRLSSDGVKKSITDLKILDYEMCAEELNTLHPQAADLQMILPPEIKNRTDILQYFCNLTLDPNTAHHHLVLSEKDRVVTHSRTEQQYLFHPDRFNSRHQVLSKESMCGRCYWEVEWSGSVTISVSYKEIRRKGQGDACGFGYNSQSWSLRCSSCSVSFWHNNIKTELRGPVSSRIGVYMDHSAGILSFYSILDTMRLLHRVHTTFTQPLYAGFRIWYDSTMTLCDPEMYCKLLCCR